MVKQCQLYVCFGSHPGNFLPTNGVRELVARVRNEPFVQACPVCGEEMRIATEQDEVILVTPAMQEAAQDVLTTFEPEKTQPLALEDAG